MRPERTGLGMGPGAARLGADNQPYAPGETFKEVVKQRLRARFEELQEEEPPKKEPPPS